MHRLLPVMVVMSTLVAACSGSRTSDGAMPDGGDTVTSQSRLLTLVEYPGWTLAEIADPWDSAAVAVTRFALVDSGADVALPEGVTRVDVPVRATVVTSSVHVAAIAELGMADAITGVTDAVYIKAPAVRARIDRGEVVDAGTSTAPTLERVIEAAPSAIIATPYAGSDHSALEALRVPVIEMPDYMEATPQARAEWLRLIGRLFGRGALADSLYEASMAEYARLKAIAHGAPERPTVITEQVTSGTWYVPGGGSYMARLLADAGADYPFASDPSAGSLALDFAAVYERAGEADYWLLKSYGSDLTLGDVKADYPLNARMKPWRTGQIYYADTAVVPLYEEFPFHPEWLLADYILIFHPSLAAQLPPARYFHRISQ